MLWKIAIIAAFAVSFVAFLVYEIVTAQEVDDDGNPVSGNRTDWVGSDV